MLAIPAPPRAPPAAGTGASITASSSSPSPFFAFIPRIRVRSRNCEHIRAALKESLASSSPNAINPAAKSSARRAAVAEVKESTDLDSALLRVGGILQAHDLNVILRHFGESKRWNEVSQIFDWMQRCEKLNFASYSSFFKYMGISGNLMKGLQVYDSISDKSTKMNVSVCNSVLGCLVRNAKFEKSMELFDQMKDDGLQPDLVTYSTLLAGCAKIKYGYIKAMHLVQELENNGLHKDSVIYGTLISICASNNLSEEAEAFFQQMLDEGCCPNIFHYSSLLNAYSLDGNYTKAEKLVESMNSSGVAPNKVILTTLLKVYAKGGLFEKGRKLLTELEDLGFAKDEMPYCVLMDNLAKSGDVQAAKAIFSEMRGKGVKIDGYSYSIMISALCRSGQLKEAKQLAKDFEASYAKYDLVMLNTLLRAYCNAGDMENVMQMMRKMDELSISPDWNTFHILIKYFCKEKLYHLAYRTIEDMNKRGHQLDEELCSVLIVQLGQGGFPSEAFSVYNFLKYSKRNMRKILHEQMLDILVAAGLLKDAYVIMKDNAESISNHLLEKFAITFMKSGNINLINDVLKAFHRAGHRINQEVFRRAITRYIGKPEKKELLLQLLQWMSGQGYVVDSLSRNLLLKNSGLFGPKQLIAEILSKQQMMLRKSSSSEVKK
ncbi:pentatricopeptide repeat-containing protein At1g10910, chloroplastic isoform X1 [Dioscorea cayenensis subsp. rotundata]|uniref:Pentatricopeptide repeat-containing protein At1g10910, chloroplastic isoform X1 n=2 Tax=Dioscorea cayennensis subsp. rotundata TaxID=55577 RepID=A0AB40B392_DIOCR|nr:pentatricopeptide repeat-containing protein At1g10910, chloroplastic isoform X1 [Dioscorea cayenensis subsp. rotundata]XP_039121800.1 pentatricopeptide repeat-containing protein At1g10910, chloroplastic isoform X1 [Dioscorea cayenensis subsp. rotundata]